MKFLVYRASAGSGKTYTLVKEYLKMALKEKNDPSAFRRILAITFTNKAAAEMKERVIKNLRELSAGTSKDDLADDLCSSLQISKDSLSQRAKSCLSAILHQYADFSIGTIDSFMHRVVKTFAYDLKLPVNFNVELDTEVVLRMAIDQVMEKIGTDASITKALIGFTEAKTEEEKSMRIEDELFAAAADLLDEESAVLINKLQHLSIDDFLEIRQKLVTKANALVDLLQKIGTECQEIIDKVGLEQNDFYYGKSGVGKLISNLNQFSIGDTLELNSYHLKALDEDIWYSAKTDSVIIQKIDSVSANLSKLLNEARILWNQESSDYILSNEILKSIYSVALLNEVSMAIDTIRDEEFIVHISEFNKRVSEIVFNEPAPFVFERLGERYQHFLIDEFQDTSVMQWQNLIPLVNNGLASNHTSIIVGDGKQAIYRFRGGEVEQFAQIPEPYPDTLIPIQIERYTLLKHFYQLVYLDTNWRSKLEIVNFNNDFYETLINSITPNIIKDVYTGHAQKASIGKEGGYVEFRFTDSDFIKEEREEFHLTNCEEIIRDHIDNKGYRYQDIALLTRNNKQGTLLAGHLINCGIPVISNESLLVKNAPEVRMMLAWMHILIRVQVDMHLFEVLKLLIDEKILSYASYEELLRKVKLKEHEVFDILKSVERLPDTDKLR
ncbi:MAG: UvrD-helicase domain-containing protein, partial [Bacteroidia bacterium]